MERETIINKYTKYIIPYIIFLVGVLGHITEETYSLITAITPFTLFAMGMFVLYHILKENGRPVLYWIIATYIVTFALEAIGVHTGLVFGEYTYGDILDPSFLGVPLIIGFNWVFVILGAACIAQHYLSRPLLFALITALITVVFDSFLEPVAIRLGYWTWETTYVPLHNYAAWFAISFAAAYALKRIRISFYTPVAIHYFIAQGLFFISLNVLLN